MSKREASVAMEIESDSLPWVEKYRPAHLSGLISHKEKINTIGRLIDANRLPHLLFYGPPGTVSDILGMDIFLDSPLKRSCAARVFRRINRSRH